MHVGKSTVTLWLSTLEHSSKHLRVSDEALAEALTQAQLMNELGEMFKKQRHGIVPERAKRSQISS